MNLIISHKIKKKEFKHGKITKIDLQKILNSFKKGIFTFINSKNLPKESHLVKVYATTISGAKRIVYLIDSITQDGFFLFYRNKNDKIGKNISIKNPEFEKSLNTYLNLLNQDIEIGAYDIYKL